MSLHPRDPDDLVVTPAPDDREPEDVAFEERPGDYERFDVTGDQDTAAAIDAARKAVSAGDCVVLPTDTVYGIGADAFSAEAVQGLLDAKDRGRDMPPPVLIGDASLLRALATDVPDQANELVEALWPGPLTIVCRIQPSLRMDLGDTDGTIALRVPDHALAREVLRRTGPLAVSSANLSGQPAALTCDEAVEQLGDRVAVYLDGGPAGTEVDGVRTSPPSTIVDFTRRPSGQVLRRGALDLAALRAVVPDLADLEEPGEAGAPADAEERAEPDRVDEPDELAPGARPGHAVEADDLVEPGRTDEPGEPGRPDEPDDLAGRYAAGRPDPVGLSDADALVPLADPDALDAPVHGDAGEPDVSDVRTNAAATDGPSGDHASAGSHRVDLHQPDQPEQRRPPEGE